MDRSCLVSRGVRRRLTNKKRPWNKALIFSCICLLLRTKRRAVLSLDDGRPRFVVGFGFVQAPAVARHGAEDALGEFLEDMEGANLMCYGAKDHADRLRIKG